jgi:bacterioferritin
MSENNSKAALVEALNRALACEYAATVQYLQQSFLVSGKERQTFTAFFAASSTEAHTHASNLGNKIVSLGGMPTVEPAPIRQATTIDEMLRHDLAMEREALDAYVKAWEAAEGNQPMRFWLEDIIRLEQLHIEELEKLTAGWTN